MSDNRTLMRDLYDSFAAGDVPTVLEAMTPDIRWTSAEGSPYAGVWVGPQAILENVFAKLAEDWDGFTVAPTEFVVEGDTVVALGEYSGTCKATGKSFRTPFAHVWKLKGGKVVAFHQHTDTVVLRRAMQG